VLDAGTTEEQSAVLGHLARSGRIRLLSAPGMALAGGRNLLVKAAQTNLVSFLDPCEILANTYVETSLRTLNSNPDSVSAVVPQRRTSDGEIQGASCFVLDTPLHWLCNDLTMTALIKKQVLEELQFDPNSLSGEADAWWWWLRCSPAVPA
jgi:hypothetical protein